MAGPRQAERRPSEVTIPQISREETERRAGRAFDSSLVAMLGQYFRGPPPAAEMREFRRMVDEAVRATPEGQTADVGAVMDRYVRDHPDSVFARYMTFSGGSSEWILNERGQVAFTQSALTRTVTAFFAAPRAQVVGAFATLSDPRNRSNSVDLSGINLVLERRRIPPRREGEEEQVIETTAGQVLHRGLAAQIGAGTNQLPATAAFEQADSRLALNSTLPPPPTDYSFKK